jgi:hypothetical protein
MRTLNFILAFTFVLTVPSLAGLPDGSLPGAGAFAYRGSSSIITAVPSIVVATR